MNSSLFISRRSLLFALFIGILVLVNLTGMKTFSVYGFTASVGILIFPITFVITDIITETFGARFSRKFIWTGLFVLFVCLLITQIFVWLPSSERFGKLDAAYTSIFHVSVRMMIASIVAFIVSQSLNIWLLAWAKKKFAKKHLWLRVNFSTIISLFFDTLIFMTLALYKITEQYDLFFVLVVLGLPYFLKKIIFSIVWTPVVYTGIKWIKKDFSSSENLLQTKDSKKIETKFSRKK